VNTCEYAEDVELEPLPRKAITWRKNLSADINPKKKSILRPPKTFSLKIFLPDQNQDLLWGAKERLPKTGMFGTLHKNGQAIYWDFFSRKEKILKTEKFSPLQWEKIKAIIIK
jgi:hypothetical protein